ncbi:MAG: cytochrome c oxidase subunit 3 [Flavobacteriales bacterium]
MTEAVLTTDQAAFTPEEERQRSFKSRRTLTWFLVFAIVMFFASLTSAYIVSKSGSYWVNFRIPTAFYISTVLVLAGSVTVQLALATVRRGGNTKAVVPLLMATLLLGAGFTHFQRKGWSELVDRGNFWGRGNVMLNKGTYGVDYTFSRDGMTLVKEGDSFYLPTDLEHARPLNADLEEANNTSSSYFFTITLAHLAHLGFGLLSLLVMIAMAMRGRYTSDDHAGLWAGTVYWHFLGGLWVYLLLFLLFVH